MQLNPIWKLIRGNMNILMFLVENLTTLLTDFSLEPRNIPFRKEANSTFWIRWYFGFHSGAGTRGSPARCIPGNSKSSVRLTLSRKNSSSSILIMFSKIKWVNKQNLKYHFQSYFVPILLQNLIVLIDKFTSLQTFPLLRSVIHIHRTTLRQLPLINFRQPLSHILFQNISPRNWPQNQLPIRDSYSPWFVDLLLVPLVSRLTMLHVPIHQLLLFRYISLFRIYVLFVLLHAVIKQLPSFLPDFVKLRYLCLSVLSSRYIFLAYFLISSMKSVESGVISVIIFEFVIILIEKSMILIPYSLCLLENVVARGKPALSPLTAAFDLRVS